MFSDVHPCSDFPSGFDVEILTVIFDILPKYQQEAFNEALYLLDWNFPNGLGGRAGHEVKA